MSFKSEFKGTDFISEEAGATFSVLHQKFMKMVNDLVFHLPDENNKALALKHLENSHFFMVKSLKTMGVSEKKN